MSDSKSPLSAQPVEQKAVREPNDPRVEATRTAASALEVTADFRPAAARADQPEYDFLAPPEAADELGRLGGYRVLSLLGEGGMGVVFEAEDALLRRRIALKAMKPRLAANAEARRRFLREAQTAASIEHENIVTIYQVGDDRGIPFIAMPLLRGETLADYMHRQGGAPSAGNGAPSGPCGVPPAERPQRDTPLPLAEILRIGREVAAGLAAAQERELIHRDIKPANIWLEAKTGRVKLLDFGLARATDEEQHLTQTGVVLGTPSYMSPEQARGEPVDHGTDLFSLGSVLYHIATGRRPFRGTSTVSTLLAVATFEPAAPATVNPCLPPALDELIRELMAKDRSARPASAAQVVERLLAIERALEDVPPGPSSQERDGLGRPSSEKRGALLEDGPPGPSSQEQDGLGRPSSEKRGALLEDGPPGPSSQQQDGLGRPSSEKPSSPPRRRRGRCLQILVAIAAAAVLLAGVIIVIKDREGKVVATVETKDAASVKAESSYTVEVKPSEPASDKREPVGGANGGNVPPPATSSILKTDFSPGPDEGYLPGVVPRPAKLPGIGRWQVAKRLSRGVMNSNTVAFSPDGRWFGTAAEDGHIRLYDTATRRLHRILVGHSAAVCVIAWSPDADVFATAGFDREIRLWSVRQAKTIAVLRGHTAPVTALAWSRDGRLASGDGWWGGRLVRIWGADGLQEADIEARGRALVWSPDGRRLAIAAPYSNEVSIATADGNQERTLDAGANISCLAFSRDGKLLAAGAFDGAVRGWKTSDWATLPTLEEASGSPVVGLAFHPDNNQLAVYNQDGRADFYDTTGMPAKPATRRGPPAWSVAWSDDGQLLAVAEEFGNVHFYDHDLSPVGESLTGISVVNPRLSSAGVAAALVSKDQAAGLCITDLDGKRHQFFHDQSLGRLDWSCDGRLLIGSLYSAKADRQIWDTHKGTLLAKWPTVAGNYGNRISPDGKRLATAGHDKKVRIWSLEGKQLAESDVLSARVMALAWRPDGRQLAAARLGMPAVLFDTSDPARIAPLPYASLTTLRHTEEMEWDRAGKRLLFAGIPPRLLELEQSRAIDFSGGRTGAKTVEFSADEHTIAVGYFDGACRLYSIDGKPGPVFSGHASTVSDIVFTDEGRHVVSASEDGRLIKWDAATGKPLQVTLILPDDQIIVFGPGGEVRFATEHAEDEVVYIIEEPSGEQVMHTPAEFRGRLASVTQEPASPPAATLKVDFSPGSDEGYLPGIVSRPAKLRGIGRWQATTRAPRGGLEFNSFNLAAFSPDGRWLGVVTNDGHVRLYDAATRRLERALLGHTGPAMAIAWSHDADVFATGGADREIRIWSVRQAKTTAILRGHTAGVTALAWSRDGRLASGGTWGEGNARIWDARGQQETTIKYPTATRSVAWSPDGQRLAVAGFGGGILVTDIGGTHQQTFEEHTNICAAVFSPDGGLLASGTFDGALRVWKTADWSVSPLSHAAAGTRVTGLAFSRDGKRLAVQKLLRTEIYETETGERYKSVSYTNAARACIAWSHDDLLAAVDGAANVDFYDRELSPVEPPVTGIYMRQPAFSSTGLCASRIDAGNKAWLQIVAADGRRKRSASEIAPVFYNWSADGRFLAGSQYGSPERHLILSDAGVLLSNWLAPAGNLRNCLSPDGKRLATAGEAKMVTIWSIEGERLAQSPVLSASISALAWHPDGRKLAIALDASTSGGPQLQVIDAPDGQPLTVRRATEMPWQCSDLAWDRHGEKLFIAGAVGVFVARTPADDAWEFTMLGKALCWNAQAIAEHPDGGSVVTGWNDGVCRLFSVDGKAGHVLRGHNGSVDDVVFIDEGKHILSASCDATLIKWDAATGKPLQTTLILPDEELIVFGPGGEVRFATEHAEDELLYVVEEPSGEQAMHTPTEFRDRLAGARQP